MANLMYDTIFSLKQIAQIMIVNDYISRQINQKDHSYGKTGTAERKKDI